MTYQSTRFHSFIKQEFIVLSESSYLLSYSYGQDNIEHNQQHQEL